MTRTHRIEITVNSDEKQTIESKANACGASVAQYVRDCSLRRVMTTKPAADLITVKSTAGTLKSRLMMLRHLAHTTNNKQILDTVEDTIALVDKTIAAAFNMQLEGEK